MKRRGPGLPARSGFPALNERPRGSRDAVRRWMAQVLEEVRRRRYRFDPLELLDGLQRLPRELGWALRLGLAPRTGDALARVHRLEHARLLREAAHLGANGAVEPGPPASSAVSAPLSPWFPSDGAPELGRWTLDAMGELASCRLDGVELADSQVLLDCVGRDPLEWPSPVDLAEGALLAQDCVAGRLQLGRAALDQGRPRLALQTYANLLRRRAGARKRTLSFEGLGWAHRAMGADRLASGALEAACSAWEDAEPPLVGRADALLARFFFALLAGEEPRVVRAAEGLEQGERGEAWESALERLLARASSAAPWPEGVAGSGRGELWRAVRQGPWSRARRVCLRLEGA